MLADVDNEFFEESGGLAARGGQVPAQVDLNLLRTFLAVYRSGSFTAAAPLLRLSQPTVTTQIRALEQQTGRALFTRSPRGAEPTHHAHELADRLAGPLDALAALEGQGTGPAARAVPVHLAGPAELLCTRALPALAPLVADGVLLRVTTGLTDPLLDGLRAGRHDLVISTRRTRGRTLPSVPLADEEFVLVAAPVWARRVEERRTADGPCAAVRDVPLVTYAEDLPIARRYWRTVFGKRLAVQAAVTVPDLRGVLAAVVAGAGYSVLPRYLCQEDITAGRLVLLDDPAEPPVNTAYLVERPGATANPDVARVRDHLLRAARSW
ncbi:LysR family transcriptional regulator [Streptomyces sp. ALI-76-A]|uniref:LysR family transcriptional regulator n=1 Tax=Streptomyces sp. ALI-76-A TaxID=3025736 RepID=UPI00256F372D|nr:LysR family transcriptional regulator [Streptomyces sp. ALI-76-A]MDL5204813.1 LysR family transcriptional regulator [Streptomyces sp. ALI-76-A]